MQISWRPNMRLAGILIAVSSAACSTQHSTYVPDGRRGFVVTCAGILDSPASCLIKAGRACGNHGYETIKGSDEDRTMLIACTVPPIGIASGSSAH